MVIRVLLTGVVLKGLTLQKCVFDFCVCISFYVCVGVGFKDCLEKGFI